MQQLGQKWGSKSYLDPKKMRLPDLAKHDFLLIFFLEFHRGCLSENIHWEKTFFTEVQCKEYFAEVYR